MTRRARYLIAAAAAAGAAALAVPGIAQAQDWRAMPVHGHDLGFVDADSVVRRDGVVRFRAQIRLDEDPSNSDFGYDRIDMNITGNCAALRGEDGRATVERRYFLQGRRVAEPDFMAERSVEEAGSLAALICGGYVGARRFASVEAAMATPDGRETPDMLAAYRSEEVELTGTVIQGFEMNAISLCGSESGCVDDAPTETCWLDGAISVPVPAGAPDWVGGGPRRDSADVIVRGRILRSRTGRGFGHVGAWGCQVVTTGPARFTTITQRRPARPDPFAAGRRPEAAAANAALTAMIAGAGGVRLARGTRNWTFNSIVPGSSDMSAACHSSPKLNDAWLDGAPGFGWSTVRSVTRAGATVTVAQSGYDENLQFSTDTPARAAELAAMAERLVARQLSAVEQQGRRVTLRFATGAPETRRFSDAGLAIEAAGLAERLKGREIARISRETNSFYALPLERTTLTFDSEAKAAEAERLMDAMRAVCAPAGGGA